MVAKIEHTLDMLQEILNNTSEETIMTLDKALCWLEGAKKEYGKRIENIEHLHVDCVGELACIDLLKAIVGVGVKE